MRLGIDLGGTKIEATVLADDGGVKWTRRVPTPAAAGYDAIVAALVELVGTAESELSATLSVGVGTPGSASPATGLMHGCNTTCLNGRPLPADLTRAMSREVRVANDANCFALSEAVDGAGQGADVVFGVIVGTGTGGGLVVGGRVLGGANGIAGEWGHNPLPWPEGNDEVPGPPCYCGKSGCIETFLSGPGLAADHVRHGGAQLDGAAIAAAADGGDAAAVATMQRYADRMARALATIIDVVDPDVIVLGGGVSNIARLYADVPQRWGAYAFSAAPLTTRLVANQHGDSSGVRGAAWLWPR